MEKEELSESNLMDLDLKDIIKVSLAISIVILLLKADLSIIIELTGKKKMVSAFNLEIVARAERVNHPIEAILVLDHSVLLLTKSKKVDTVL